MPHIRSDATVASARHLSDRAVRGSVNAAHALLLGWYLGDGYLVRAGGDVWVLSVFDDAR
ncbi:MAG: hypothetical protein H0U77_03650 [Nocardioidaceae bacterium]|nr:hypothetical protein [Nocardioidaceae bacterium]